MGEQNFEAFARGVRADAERIFVTRAGKTLRLSQLSKADQNAHIDRWFADGFDPVRTVQRSDEPTRKTAPVGEVLGAPIEPHAGPTYDEALKHYGGRSPEVSKSQPIAGSDELFFGWVQRSLQPSGFEWIRVSMPRHIAEMFAVPDKIGRKSRKDTREIMMGEIVGELSSWNLAKETRR